jgi:HlyD family secretion protein
VEIRLRVAQPPNYLRHEMTVSLDIETAKQPSALIAPAEAIRDLQTTPWVQVVREGRVVRQAVQLGLRGEGHYQILSGLQAGEWLIPAPQTARIGQRVRPQPRQTP